MEIAVTKTELKAWLASATAVTLISVSLTNDVAELWSNISSPKTFNKALEKNPAFFVDGPYLVAYENTDDGSSDLDYSNFAVAFTAITKLTRGPIAGGLNKLIPALSDYEYIQKVSRESFGFLGHLWIAVPSFPPEIEKLERILKAHSLMYAFPDGSGTFNTGNLKFGGGLST